MEESSTGKKPVRPKKPKQAAARDSPLEATAHAADKTSMEVGGPTQSTIQETQTPPRPGPENLMVELQEHAALAEHDRHLDSEAMEVDAREGGGASEHQEEHQQEHRHRQQKGQQPEEQPASEFRAYDTHQQTPTA